MPSVRAQYTLPSKKRAKLQQFSDIRKIFDKYFEKNYFFLKVVCIFLFFFVTLRPILDCIIMYL